MNPVLPGFHPDPSIVGVDGVYYLVTSTFEYLPALPVYRSEDLESWELIGHVATRDEQVSIARSPTPGGVWAPTIRHHDGRFHLIVSVMFNARGCVVFTADAAEGPWSDGVVIPVVDGIDPDLAWDDEGTAFVTYAVMGQGILQVRVDLDTGAALEEPRSLWSGTGLHAPEGPHLYRRGDDWYLLIAEGGTERGHAVSIARGSSPSGPFEGFAGNPILSARSTNSPVQNLGHADLVEAPDGRTALVALGVRPVGFTRSFSPLGRETFLTTVDWVDGWPRVRPVEVAARSGGVVELLDPERALDEQGWLGVRQDPSALVQMEPDRVILVGGGDLDDPRPRFVGRRQQHLAAAFSACVDVADGTGGIAGRHSETHWFSLDARSVDDRVLVTARAALSGFAHEWTAELDAGEVVLSIRTRLPSGDRARLERGGDRVLLAAASAATPDNETVLAELDGRYWSFETTESFTGRVLGIYATAGSTRFTGIRYEGMP